MEGYYKLHKIPHLSGSFLLDIWFIEGSNKIAFNYVDSLLPISSGWRSNKRLKSCFVEVHPSINSSTHTVSIDNSRHGYVARIRLREGGSSSNLDIDLAEVEEASKKLVKKLTSLPKPEIIKDIDYEATSFIFYPVINSDPYNPKEDENLELRTAWLEGINWYKSKTEI